jgi:hypothetical protein
MTYTFKITEGCPKTGHKIACNTTQDAPAFSQNIPIAADRAKEGMAKHQKYRSDEAAFRVAKVASKGQTKSAPKRWLSNEDMN